MTLATKVLTSLQPPEISKASQSLIYCCCFLSFKKGTGTLSIWSFTQEMVSKLQIGAEQNSAGGVSAEGVLKEEVVTKLTESTTLQGRSVNCRLSHTDKEKRSCVDTMVFICFHAAGARCWLARLDTGTFCLIQNSPGSVSSSSSVLWALMAGQTHSPCSWRAFRKEYHYVLQAPPQAWCGSKPQISAQ